MLGTGYIRIFEKWNKKNIRITKAKENIKKYTSEQMVKIILKRVIK